MKHRVTINMAFDKESDAKSFMTTAKNMIAKAVSINEDADNSEISSIEYHKCYHDETPTKPCEVIERQEVKKGKVVTVKEVRNEF